MAWCLVKPEDNFKFTVKFGVYRCEVSHVLRDIQIEVTWSET